MGEVIRISISLKVDTGDETYWTLIEPLQKNRQLSTFIITCLKAYVEDSDIHDAIDMYSKKGSGVDRIREHIENLMKLQAKANRTAQDINNSLGGDSKEFEIENVLDDMGEEETDNSDNSVEVQSARADLHTSQIVGKPQKSQAGVKVANNAEVVALPASVEPAALNKIIKRLDSLEQTVGSLSSRVGANSAQISKIEEYKNSSDEQKRSVSETKVTGESTGTVQGVAVNKRTRQDVVKSVATKKELVKAAVPVKEVKFENVEATQDNASNVAPDKMDFSDLLSGFMDSVQ